MNTLINVSQKLLYLIVKMSPVFLLLGLAMLFMAALTPIIAIIAKGLLYVGVPGVLFYFGYKYIDKLIKWLKSFEEKLDRLTNESGGVDNK